MDNVTKPSITENATTENRQAGAMNNIRANQNQWCFAWLANAPEVAPGTNEKAGLLNDVKWQQGSANK